MDHSTTKGHLEGVYPRKSSRLIFFLSIALATSRASENRWETLHLKAFFGKLILFRNSFVLLHYDDQERFAQKNLFEFTNCVSGTHKKRSGSATRDFKLCSNYKNYGFPGANPTISSCNASVVKIYNATSSLVRYKKSPTMKKRSILCTTTLALYLIANSKVIGLGPDHQRTLVGVNKITLRLIFTVGRIICLPLWPNVRWKAKEC
jgi:hypothetical protein